MNMSKPGGLCRACNLFIRKHEQTTYILKVLELHKTKMELVGATKSVKKHLFSLLFFCCYV